MIGMFAADEAEAKAAQVEYLLMRLKQGLSELPPGEEIDQAKIEEAKAAIQELGLPTEPTRDGGTA